jgi:hypothetical protein
MEFNPTPTLKKARFKRLVSVLVIILAIISGLVIEEQGATRPTDPPPKTQGKTVESANEAILKDYKNASEALAALAVKGRAPKTGYARAQFGNGWSKSGDCDTRNQILARDLADVLYEINSCIVLSGKLNDPYTGKQITFLRGSTTSAAVQIDHVVALSDAWQKGAQLLSPQLREKFANDGLNLLAVDGNANQNKSDGDAATWLPANKSMRCAYIARQISVKLKYTLWITSAEKNAMEGVLKSCPDQELAF